MRAAKKAAVALVALMIAVLTIDGAAQAATGQSLILGKLNQAGKVTVVKNNGNGSAARFVSSGPPIAVSNGKKVGKLNADRLDGKHAGAFAPAAHAPVAVATITFDASQVYGRGIASATWNHLADRYVISLDAGSYGFTNMTTVVTPRCNGVMPSTSNAGGKLHIQLEEADGSKEQCKFSVVVYRN